MLPSSGTPNIRVPFNLFANTATLVERYRSGLEPARSVRAWVFEVSTSGGNAAASLDILYPAAYAALRAGWRYDSSSSRWLRTLAGKPAIEKPDGTSRPAPPT